MNDYSDSAILGKWISFLKRKITTCETVLLQDYNVQHIWCPLTPIQHFVKQCVQTEVYNPEAGLYASGTNYCSLTD